jgi:hypothetical protein
MNMHLVLDKNDVGEWTVTVYVDDESIITMCVDSIESYHNVHVIGSRKGECSCNKCMSEDNRIPN